MVGAVNIPKLVCISAPSGYGKTVLLTQLYRAQTERHTRCIWVSLDERDTTVSELAFLLDFALTRSDSKCCEPVMERIVDGAFAYFDAVAENVCHLSGDVTVFIDNLQFCVDDDLRYFLDRLIFGSGSNLKFVFASASIIPVDDVRVSLEIWALSVGVEQLKFEYEDVEGVFKSSRGRLPNSSTLAFIRTMTEGWPAAVRLIQVLVERGWSDSEVCERFTSRKHDILAALIDRVLSGFDEKQRHFMQKMALFPEFSIEFAVDVADEPQAGALVNEFLRRNALVFPLGYGHCWLRMHALLRQHLQVTGGGGINSEERRILFMRAAKWHADRGDLVVAIDFALDGSNEVYACQLLDQVSRLIVGGQGRFDLYISWVKRLLSVNAPISLNSLVWYALSLCCTLKYEEVLRTIDLIDSRAGFGDQLKVENIEVWIFSRAMRIVADIHLDQLQKAHGEALLWLHGYSLRDALTLVTLASSAAYLDLTRESLDEAQRHVDVASGAAERSGSPYAMAWVTTLKACIYLKKGMADDADSVLLAARPSVVALIGTESNAVAVMDFVRSRALLDLGRVDDAREAAQSGLRGAARHGLVDTAALGLSCCVALSEFFGCTLFSAGVLDAVVNVYPPRLARMLWIMRVRYMLRDGRISEAQELVERRMLFDLHGDNFVARGGDFLLAQLELNAAGGDSDGLWNRLLQEIKIAKVAGRIRDLVELYLLASYLSFRQGDKRNAFRQLSLSIAEASKHKLVWPFLFRARQLQPFLANVSVKHFGLVKNEEIAILERLFSAVGSGDASRSAVSAMNMQAESLTPREAQLLDYLAQGASNQQIAERMSLSIETVKWHLKNLYGKLGVKGRVSALIRARALRMCREL
jgi:LuxR family maltose regulon positive regulatory protein